MDLTLLMVVDVEILVLGKESFQEILDMFLLQSQV
jgi:hypothetical protein